MTIYEFCEYIDSLTDRLHSHWTFMNQHHSDQWQLEMDKVDWVEQLIAFVENDCDEVDD